MLTIFLSNPQNTQRLGYLIGKYALPGSTLLLTGDLGTGKTTLVQGIGKGLGISELIVSPTFTLVNEYLDGRLPLYHLDLYRLEPSSVNDIYPEMYWSGIETAPGITAIEWSERLSVYPPSYIKIELAVSSQGREVRIQPEGINSQDLKFIESFSPTARS